jgi:hypothetical protein
MWKLTAKSAAILTCLVISSQLFAAQTYWVEDNYLGINVYDDNYFFDMGTAASNTPSNGTMLYQYLGVGTQPYGTSDIVVRIDGLTNTYTGFALADSSTSIVTSPIASNGTYIQGTRRFRKQTGPTTYSDLVDLTTRWELVNNPATGVNADTCMFKFIFYNPTLTTHYVALRLELDTMILQEDGTNISVDNGVSVITNGSAWYKSLNNIPVNWWDYDIDPNIGTPNLVGRGYLKNNNYGEKATEPDIFEVNYWYNVNSYYQWYTAPVGSAIGSDSALVLWWLNGNSPSSAGYTLSPGQSLTFITYYGINQEKLLTTPTITPTFTFTPSVTNTLTISPTLTITLSSTPSFTSTVSRTLTVSPTWSLTNTITNTPSYTVTRTITPTYTDSETSTITLTSSVTPSITNTPSITLTLTVTDTFTVTQTQTVTFTVTLTPTLTPTPPDLVLNLKGNFPNPFVNNTHIVYWLSTDATVEIKVFTVSGEVVRRATGIDGKKGYNDYFWDGLNNSSNPVASGVFIYRVYAATARQEAASEFAKAACVK